jgi:hypothetical protein
VQRSVNTSTKLRSLPSGRLSLLAGLVHGWLGGPRLLKQVLLLEARHQPHGPTGSLPEADCMGIFGRNFPCVVDNKAPCKVLHASNYLYATAVGEQYLCTPANGVDSTIYIQCNMLRTKYGAGQHHTLLHVLQTFTTPKF